MIQAFLAVYFLGSVMMNADPFPTVLFAVMVPPCRSTIFRQMARPMPVPEYGLLLPCSR